MKCCEYVQGPIHNIFYFLRYEWDQQDRCLSLAKDNEIP
jgi:hypothetical protein